MYPASVEYLNRRFIWKLRRWTLCAFVCIALLLPYVLGFCLSGFCLFVFSIVFSASYHWWICFLVWLLSSFFLPFFFYYFLIFLTFNIFLFFNNFIFSLSFFLSFSLSFSLFFWSVWLTGSWCSGRVSGLCLSGGRAKFRTMIHQRSPSST